MHGEPNAAPIIWFEIVVADLTTAETFYGRLLGWTFRPFEEYDPDNYHIVSTPQGTLGGALVRAEAAAQPGGQKLGVTLYAEVPDLTAALDRAGELGAETIQEPRVIGSADGWFAIVVDPDGNRLGLWSSSAP
jgi:uncharacterized protein